jgi:AcrR family transcriptional regulator
VASPKPPPGGGRPAHFEPADLSGLPAELALARLPAGRHGLPRAFVARNQRLRIVAAMLRVLPRHGYPTTTIADVTREAGVSRAAFYQQFAGKEECFLAAYDLASAWFCERIEAAVADRPDWADRLRTGVAEALHLLAGNPAVAHLFAIEGLQAGPAARQRQRAGLARFASVLQAGPAGRIDVPPDLEELLLGGAVQLIASYVDSGRGERLPEATEALVERLLIPYLGDEGGRSDGAGEADAV